MVPISPLPFVVRDPVRGLGSGVTCILVFLLFFRFCRHLKSNPSAIAPPTAPAMAMTVPLPPPPAPGAGSGAGAGAGGVRPWLISISMVAVVTVAIKSLVSAVGTVAVA